MTTPIHHASKYTPELADKICEKLEQGLSLKKICSAPDMPQTAAVIRWVRKIPEFAEEYAKARKTQLELIADECLDLSDDDSNDIGPDGRPNTSAVQRHRLMIDTRKFLLAHLMPEKYGTQNIKQEVSGPNGGPIAVTQVPKEELARWLAFQLSQSTTAKEK